MNFLDSVVDSPDGFLHEWWSIFYEVFTSRQGKDQETGQGSSSKLVITNFMIMWSYFVLFKVLFKQ